MTKGILISQEKIKTQFYKAKGLIQTKHPEQRITDETALKELLDNYLKK